MSGVSKRHFSNVQIMILSPNVSTTPITAMGCQQNLPLSVVQQKGKHCRKPHCLNGVVDSFRLSMDGGHVAKKRIFSIQFLIQNFHECNLRAAQLLSTRLRVLGWTFTSWNGGSWMESLSGHVTKKESFQLCFSYKISINVTLEPWQDGEFAGQC